MPITLPAHALAVLPLGRLAPGLPTTALVCGACAPDLAYALGWSGRLAHRLPHGLLWGLAAGVALTLWTEHLLLPALRRALPRTGGMEWSRFAHPAPLPSGVRGWLTVGFAVSLGALTHLLWDGFTHTRLWPASALYPTAVVALGPLELPVARLLQHLSSLVGTAAVLALLWRRYPDLPPRPPGHPRAFALLVGAALGGVLFGVAWRQLFPIVRDWPSQELWFTFWTAVRFALLTLTLAAFAVLRRFPPATEPS